MIYKLDRVLESFLPGKLYRNLIQFYRKLKGAGVVQKFKEDRFLSRMHKTEEKHFKAIDRIKNKSVIRVVFLVIHESVWKYEGVYRLMEADRRYDPVIVICPSIVHGKEMMQFVMEKAYRYFSSSGYNVISANPGSSGKWLDIKKDIGPDMVFFSNPHPITLPRYYIYHLRDCLTCYVPYGIMTPNRQQDQFNKPFHNLLWRAFYETTVHKEMAEKYARNKGRNVIVSGYPVFDTFAKREKEKKDVWKRDDSNLKRIIWAPHHTLELFRERQNYSTFLRYAHFMLELAHEYSSRIQIAFKPHPTLRAKLSKDNVWGKEKTDAYYNKWKTLSNGQLEEGAYADLFLTSDGMILDSISFIVEYLYTGKPMMFTVNKEDTENKFNEFGAMAFEQLYKGYSEKDIREFLQKVVFEGDDPQYERRKAFFHTHFNVNPGKGASEVIFNHINGELFPE